jgi:hypothetical protein
MNLDIRYHDYTLHIFLDGQKVFPVAVNATTGDGSFPDYAYAVESLGPRKLTPEERDHLNTFLRSEVMDLMKWWHWTRGLRGGDLTPPANDPALQAAIGRIAELKSLPGYPQAGVRYSVELTPEMVDALLKIRS